MIPPRASLRGFAAAVFAHETPNATSPDEVAAGAAAAYRKLDRGLRDLVGSAGLVVLLKRSLVLAQRASPLLAHVSVGAGGELEGLVEAARGAEIGVVRDAAVTLLARFMDLLATFIGEPLTVRLLRGIWPEVAQGTSDADDEETEG